MIRRQQRTERMKSVEQEYLAATSAVRLLETQLQADPSWGDREGWRNRDARLLTGLLQNAELGHFIEAEVGLLRCFNFKETAGPPRVQ